MNQSAEKQQADAPLDPFVRARVLTRLREAVELAETIDADDAQRLEAVLEDVRDRVRGWEAVRATTGRSRAVATRCTAALGGGGEPVSEFLLVPFGRVEVDGPLIGRDFEFTPAHGESARRWFERLDRKLAIDYEHQSIDRFNNREGGLRPAAGWIGGLAVRDDGLWAIDVNWTPRAAELLRSGEYRYFSPVIYWTDEQYTDVAALGPVALTNDPAMCGVSPLAAARSHDLAGAESQGDDGDGRLCDVEAHEAAGGAGEAQASALRAAHTEIALLERRIAAHEADAFVAEGMRLGKIVDSTSMDWRADFLADSRLAMQRLQRAPVVLPPGRMRYAARHAAMRDTAHRGECAATGVRSESVDAADFDAFERAVAAGRVRFAGGA